MNEISFNSSLIKELRAIAMTQRLADEAGFDLGHRRKTFLHMIHADDEVEDLDASSKLNAEWAYLQLLFERGRGWADAWLDAHFDDLGARSTLDLDEIFEDAPRPRILPRRRRRARLTPPDRVPGHACPETHPYEIQRISLCCSYIFK